MKKKIALIAVAIYGFLSVLAGILAISFVKRETSKKEEEVIMNRSDHEELLRQAGYVQDNENHERWIRDHESRLNLAKKIIEIEGEE